MLDYFRSLIAYLEPIDTKTLIVLTNSYPHCKGDYRIYFSGWIEQGVAAGDWNCGLGVSRRV
jgi:hypothetical protein